MSFYFATRTRRERATSVEDQRLDFKPVVTLISHVHLSLIPTL